MLQQRISRLAQLYYPKVVELRRHLHSHPELSWQEHNTSALVAETLTGLGMQVQPVHTPLGNTGLVAVLQGGQAGSKCIALRADMDALPITEANEVSYCSQHRGVMHACGHDVHTANLLGVAMVLSAVKEHIAGTYKFIFQPSEEKIPSGAQALIAAGVLQNPAPSCILGLHVSPELDAGTFGFCSGPFMASSDELYIRVTGKGGHAAQPQHIINPLYIAADILSALKTKTDLNVPVVVSFGKITAEGATNVVPNHVDMAGTLRCFDEKVRAEMLQTIGNIARQTALEQNAVAEVEVLSGYPVLVNDIPTTEKCRSIAGQYLPPEAIKDLPQRMGSEDFAYYTHQIPACFYRMGTGNTERNLRSGLHTPTFDIDEQALQHSVGLMSWLAANL